MTQHSCGNPKPNRHPHLHSVLPEPGPQHSAGHIDARRVECVSFNYRVTVYPADDYDRKGTWMHAADDRMKFRRRIEQTELIFAPVLNEKYLRHRDRAINEHCREWIFNNRQLQSAVSRFCGHYCVRFCIVHSGDISLLRF